MRLLSPTERIIAWRLASGRRITRTEFISALYNENNIAKQVNYIIKTRINSLRLKCPIEIKANRGIGGFYIDEKELENFRNWLAKEVQFVDYNYKPSGKRTYKYHAIISQ